MSGSREIHSVAQKTISEECEIVDGEGSSNIISQKAISGQNGISTSHEKHTISGSETSFMEPNTLIMKSGGLQAIAAESFNDWAYRNRSWIFLFVNHGITLQAQDAILEQFNALFQVRQLRINFATYINFVPEKYVACGGHMLLMSYKTSQQTKDVCFLPCKKTNGIPEIATFEYPLLLSRIKPWVADEESCNHLFSYHGQKIASFQSAAGGDLLPPQSCED